MTPDPLPFPNTFIIHFQSFAFPWKFWHSACLSFPRLDVPLLPRYVKYIQRKDANEVCSMSEPEGSVLYYNKCALLPKCHLERHIFLMKDHSADYTTICFSDCIEHVKTSSLHFYLRKCYVKEDYCFIEVVLVRECIDPNAPFKMYVGNVGWVSCVQVASHLKCISLVTSAHVFLH